MLDGNLTSVSIPLHKNSRRRSSINPPPTKLRKKFMRAKIVGSLIGLALICSIAASLAISRGSHQGKAPSNFGQERPKSLREIAMERDVEVPGLEEISTEYHEYSDLKELAKEARVIVYGRVTERNSYFDDSALPFEHGRIIMTKYTVDVLKVLKDRTPELIPMLPPDKPPAPVKTPLEITRNGGVVYVNGHRASMKVRGYEEMIPGQEYIFFLFWSKAYNTYSLAGNISGVVAVNFDSSLRSLASSEEMKSRVGGMTLESPVSQIK
jgi:hypothetical protein